MDTTDPLIATAVVGLYTLPLGVALRSPAFYSAIYLRVMFGALLPVAAFVGWCAGVGATGFFVSARIPEAYRHVTREAATSLGPSPIFIIAAALYLPWLLLLYVLAEAMDRHARQQDRGAAS